MWRGVDFFMLNIGEDGRYLFPSNILTCRSMEFEDCSMLIVVKVCKRITGVPRLASLAPSGREA